MGTVQIPMVNFHICRCVLGWVAVLYGGVPHWQVKRSDSDRNSYIPMRNTPNFKGDFQDVQDFLLPVLYHKGFEVILSMKYDQSVCILGSAQERYNAYAPTPSLAVTLAGLEMAGIKAVDVDENWVEVYNDY